jgi:ABC-2 type transport system ATP-binding protein
MSITVRNLSKFYGKQQALKDVSFHVDKGEIIGLLGPNGAGKSTLMKIISGYIPPSQGSAFVCDIDVEKNAVEAKRKIGYLPENNALYSDMYVHEYLYFVAKLYSRNKVSVRVNQMIEWCGLTKEQNKKLAALSKGYKQRVGLAQALIHQPEVLILDEPTTGLDPNQLVEIRKLIVEVGKEKTVILSSHIMQEVEAMCSRVIIINQGEIIADDQTENLSHYLHRGEKIILELEEEVLLSDFDSLNAIQQIKALGNHTWEIIAKENEDIRKKIFAHAVQNGWNILSLKKENNSLEQIFQELTA